jgi:hypothetical protein
MQPLLFSYERVLFQCDISGGYGDYTEMHLAWYDSYHKEDSGKSLSKYFDFMIVKKGIGFEMLRTNGLQKPIGASLSDLPLKLIYEEKGGPLPLLTQMINPLAVLKGTIMNTEVDIASFTEIMRRLTIYGYEEVRKEFNQFVKFEEFYDLTEEQMLRPTNLIKLRTLLSE